MKMRLLVFTIAGVAARMTAVAQEPDETGKHPYAGKSCTWASYNDEQYVEMAYSEHKGRIDPQEALPGVRAPFVWRMVHPDGNTVASSSSTARDALNALCDAMIAADVAARAADLPNREAAFRELLLALGKNTEQP